FAIGKAGNPDIMDKYILGVANVKIDGFPGGWYNTL
ncbi:hypothetical protein SS7213T_03410, partial [Staphylococcus simiae CCM 7213 = CCUG 51256]